MESLKLNKDEIVHIAENLFDEAVNAKSYLQIIKQFRENVNEYNNEINCSSAFYNVVYNSLVESLFLNLFKLYDRNPKSISIFSLVKEMRGIKEDDLDEYVLKNYQKHENKFLHWLNVEEESYFIEEVERTRNLCICAGVTYNHTTVLLTLQDIINLYGKRYKSLKNTIIENLIQRRNKIGAHNDAKTNFDYKKINEEFPIIDNQIDSIVEFAIEFLQFCIEILTGVHKIPEYTNINDWGMTLNLVRDGIEYRNIQKNN